MCFGRRRGEPTFFVLLSYLSESNLKMSINLITINIALFEFYQPTMKHLFGDNDNANKIFNKLHYIWNIHFSASFQFGLASHGMIEHKKLM